MRFFNLDLHIGVIADLKQIFGAQGHTVTDWTISSLSRVIGRERDAVDVVNEKTWKQINPQMCDAFYERYKDELSVYDGFIVTHTPCFTMLYARWQKPVICVASTRYEHPFSDNATAWQAFNEYLRTAIDSGLVIPVANNRYDADYAELFTQRKWQVIPSLCNYTGAHYTGSSKNSLLHSRFPDVPPFPRLARKDKAFRSAHFWSRVRRKLRLGRVARGYTWQDLADYRSIVHMPYQVSTMSIFEMYAAGIPMLFPTLRFALQLYADKSQGIFSELSYNQVRHLPPGSAIDGGPHDPNRFDDAETMSDWIAKADFYGTEMPGLMYFDSFEELGERLSTMDTSAVHDAMVAGHELRTNSIHQVWAQLLDRIALAGT